MVPASGSLSSASHVVEGVPLSSLAILPNNPIAPKTGASLSPEIGAPPILRNKYALKFSVRGGKAYLSGYDADMGVLFGDFADAKLFSLEAADVLSDLFHCEVVRVLIHSDGTKKLALMGEQERWCADTGAKNNSASETKADASAERADGDGEIPPSFLIHAMPIGKTAQLEDGKRLLFHFIESFLGVRLFGIQSGFGVRPDSLLFIGPRGSTLAVPVDTLLEPRDIALEIVKEKIRRSGAAFENGAA